MDRRVHTNRWLIPVLAACWLMTIGCSRGSAQSETPAPVAPTPAAWPGLSAFMDEVGANNVGLTADAKPFGLEDHRNAIRAMTGIQAECTDSLISAQWRQDILHQQDSEAHFDNCAFTEGLDFIASQRARALASFAKPGGNQKDHYKEGLVELGKAIHALQDFYAHSNYVELRDENAGASPDRSIGLPIVPVWTDAGRALVESMRPNGLVSGTWAIGGPKRCAAKNGVPPLKHGQLAKDAFDTDEGKTAMKHAAQWDLKTRYEAALQLAYEATRAFVKNTLPPNVRAFCGGDVAFTVLVERGRDATP